jgi:hypothetical protein
VNALGSVPFTYSPSDPLFNISSIRENADWFFVNDDGVFGTAPNVDQKTVYSFLAEGMSGNTTTFRYVDVNVLPCSDIDIIQSPGGVITPSNDFKTSIKEKHTFEFKANNGFGLADVLIDGLSDPTAVKTGKYTLEAVKEKHTVTAVFSPLFSVNVGANGSVYSNGSTLKAGANSVLVDKGTNKQFIFVPNYGYKVDKVEVNGINNTDAVMNGNYTFNNVQIAQSLKVTFTEVNFSIIIEQRLGETIISTEKRSVLYNVRETVDFVPSAGYSIHEIFIDGVKSTSAESDHKYAFIITKDFSVVVKLNRLSYAISYSVSSGSGTGTISMVGTGNVLHGHDRTFNITPAVGYQISSVTLGTMTLTGAELEAVRISGRYTFYNVTETNGITVSFTKMEYNLTVVTDGNGTANDGSFAVVKVAHDTSFEINIVPNIGYVVKSISVDGIPIDGSDLSGVKITESFVLKEVQRSQTVSITFEKVVLNVSISTVGGGTIFTETEILWKTDQKYEFLPEKGYYIKEVLVDGIKNEDAEAKGFHIFKKIQGNHSLHVTFEKIYFTITFNKRINGSSTYDIISVEYGTSKRIYFDPPTGYMVSYVLVDNSKDEDAKAEGSFEFKDIMKDHNIRVDFGRKSYVISASSEGDGRITPKTADVGHDDQIDMKINPGTGNRILSVTVNGMPLNNIELDIIRVSGSYRLINVMQAYDIHVVFEKTIYNITFLSIGNGTINSKSYGTEYAFHGETAAFAIVPDIGHFLKDVVIDGRFLSGSDFAHVAKYREFKFYEVSEDHLISVTFERNTYKVETESGENGMVSPDSSLNSIMVQHGKMFVLNAHPEPGYRVASVQCNGGYIENIGGIRETGRMNIEVLSDIHVLVSFEKISYTVSFSAEEGGCVNGKVSGTETVLHGENIAFLITPPEGLRIADVLIDGISMTDLETIRKEKEFCLTDVVSDHTFIVLFERIVPKVTVSLEGKGTVTPWTSEIEWKGHKNFEFRSQEGYYLKTVLVDGIENEEAQRKGSMFFEMLQCDHTLHVVFAKIQFGITVKKDIDGTVTTEYFIVDQKESKMIYFEPAGGYEITSVLVDGTENDNARVKGSITFEHVVNDHEVLVKISKKGYTISLDVSGNGTVALDKKDIMHGDEVKINIFPGPGNILRSVVIDGHSVSDNTLRTIITLGHYVLTDIREDHNVMVVFESLAYTVKFSSLGNGKINSMSNGEKRVYHGGDVFLSIIPYSGYFVKDVVVNGNFLKGSDLSLIIANEGFSFYDVIRDHSLSVTFERTSCSVKMEGGKNGTISPDSTMNDVWVQYDYGFTFYAYPDIGYRVSSAICNGIPISDVQMQMLRTQGKLILGNVVSDLDISVSFEKIPYTISFSAGEGGSINGKTSGAETAVYGDNARLSVIPYDGFRMADMKIDGISVDLTGIKDSREYCFSDVTKDHEIAVLFERIFPEITVTSTDGGNVSPDGIMNIVWKGHQNFEFGPMNGYYVKAVFIDGIENTEAKNRGSYFFTDHCM